MRLYLRAISYFRADLPLICIWIILTLSGSGLGLCAAWPMAVMVDSILTRSSGAVSAHPRLLLLLPHNHIGQIAVLAAVGLLIKLAQDLLNAVQTVVSNQVNYNGLMRIRCDLYRKFQVLSMSYHRSQPQGDSISRLSSDTFGCQTILGALISMIVASLTLAVMSAVLMSRSVTLTALAFSIVPMLAVANITFGRRLKARSLECRERDSEFTTTIQRALACMGLVQAFGREAEEFRQFRGTLRETISAWRNLNREQIIYNLLVGTLFGVGGAIIFGYGGYLVYSGKLALGDLLIFLSYLGIIWGPLCTLTGFSANVQGGVAGAERVFEVLDRDLLIRDNPGARPLPRQPRTLELQNVCFDYGQSASPILKNVSVLIRPGEMVAFVGSSGVGKSTLLNLLPRFYDPKSGILSLDGIDLREVRLADLRRHVALVLQDSVILPATIAENIAYGRPSATREQIAEAAAMAGAKDFIESLPDRYETALNEGGSNLSGGQRQRIAIARALLTEAPFIVLDEPTSSLDSAHEQWIIETLERLRGKRTIILVSHRLSAVRQCNQIIVMDRGLVVERGTHDELSALNGLYASMAARQRLDATIPLAQAA